MTMREHTKTSASLFGEMANECNWPRLWKTCVIVSLGALTIIVTLLTR